MLSGFKLLNIEWSSANQYVHSRTILQILEE